VRARRCLRPASIDSLSVKAADTVGATTRGFEGGKKISGRTRHIAVDTVGLLLAVCLTAASAPDRDGAHPLLAALRQGFCPVRLVWANLVTPGVRSSGAASALHLTVTVVKRGDDTTGFVVLARRRRGPARALWSRACGVDGSGTLGAR